MITKSSASKFWRRFLRASTRRITAADAKAISTTFAATTLFDKGSNILVHVETVYKTKFVRSRRATRRAEARAACHITEILADGTPFYGTPRWGKKESAPNRTKPFDSLEVRLSLHAGVVSLGWSSIANARCKAYAGKSRRIAIDGRTDWISKLSPVHGSQ